MPCGDMRVLMLAVALHGREANHAGKRYGEDPRLTCEEVHQIEEYKFIHDTRQA